MNKISIICSGENYNKNKIIKYCNSSDYIIAVDGGLKILNNFDINPDIIIGDMDSIDENILKKYSNIKKEIYPTDKDLTDSEIAIKSAVKLKAKKIFVFASTGSYMDHSIANIINLVRNYNKKNEIKIITGNSVISLIKKEKILINLKGRRISFFPIGYVKDIKMEGFMYNFKNKKNLSAIDYSISNVITENRAKISVKKGYLICILFDKGYK